MKNSTKSLVNLNNHLLCAIDLETTGTQWGWHEITQIGILPLDQDIQPSTEYPPLDIKIKPLYPERVDPEALRVTNKELVDYKLNGMDPEAAMDLLHHWFTRLNLGEKKQVVPLGCNYAFDRGFLQHFLGHENYWAMFNNNARDIQTIALYLNDKSEFDAEQTPFPKVMLRWLCNCLKIEIIEGSQHDALYDCKLTAEVYRKLLTEPVSL